MLLYVGGSHKPNTRVKDEKNDFDKVKDLYEEINIRMLYASVCYLYVRTHNHKLMCFGIFTKYYRMIIKEEEMNWECSIHGSYDE